MGCKMKIMNYIKESLYKVDIHHIKQSINPVLEQVKNQLQNIDNKTASKGIEKIKEVVTDYLKSNKQDPTPSSSTPIDTGIQSEDESFIIYESEAFETMNESSIDDADDEHDAEDIDDEDEDWI